MINKILRLNLLVFVTFISISPLFSMTEKERKTELKKQIKLTQSKIPSVKRPAMDKIFQLIKPNDGKIIGPRLTQALIDALKDKDSYVRGKAVEALDKLENKSAIPALIEALKDKDPAVRIAIAEVLGKLGDASAVPILIDALKNADYDVRVRAVDALGKLQESAIPLLVKALRDPDPYVRINAAEVLGKLGDMSIVPILEELTNDENNVVKKQAEESVSNIKKRLADTGTPEKP